MSEVNTYATLTEFMAMPELDTAAPGDDTFIEDLLTRCSREFDGDTGYWFYAHQQTRRYDLPKCRVLRLDAPLLSVTSLTNGDNTHVASSEYDLTPYNGVHYTALELHEDSTTQWQVSAGGRTRGVVYVNGTWGYVDRTATDPESATPIQNSKSATLYLALTVYKKRHGQGIEGVATITGAGVVITPEDKSRDYWSIVKNYRKHL